MTARKPRLSLAEAQMLCECDAQICRGAYSTGYGLEQLFSDVHDSGLYASKVTPLVRKRLLRRVPLTDRIGDGSLLGHHWTVDLTDKAMSLFWPDLYDKWLSSRMPMNSGETP